MRHFRVGLTGGIASGKSTVARLFAQHGVPVIDTDEMARAVVRPGQPALAEIVRGFGPGVLEDDGSLDRRALRERIFGHESERLRLEAILHPHIEAATLAAADRAGGPYQLLVVPLLLEAGFDRHVDRILVVDCPESVQRHRLLARDRDRPELVERILAAQVDRATRLRRADDVVDNGGEPGELEPQVASLHGRYLDLAAKPPAARS
jgi:dephospho-CoA kinase